MNDDAMVKVMQALSLDYNPAIQATQAFEFRIASLNKQLLGMKAMALQSVKDINSTFSSTLGTLGGNKTILDQWGQPLKTIQAEAEKTATTIKDITGKTVKPPKIEPTKIPKPDDKEFNIWADQWNRRIQWFISGAAFYGGIKAAKAAVESMSEVEMGVTEIARVMEDSSFVFNDYRDQLLQLGVDYGQSFENVQDIALRWAQAGYNVKDSLENTKTSLLALNTAELDASTATESLIGIMAQWGLTSSELPLVLDKINKTADDYTATSQDLIDGLLRSSGAAKIMGMSLEENIAVLTTMREATGRTGREIGNAWNSILSYIQRPSAIKAFEQLGIKMFSDEASTQFRPAMQIFSDLAQRWDTASDKIKDGFVSAAQEAGLFSEELAIAAVGTQGLTEVTEQANKATQDYMGTLTDVDKRDAAQAAAGVYRRNYLIALIERFSKVQEVLNNMTDAAGYSQAENTRTMDTLAKKYESLKTAAKQLAIALGDAGLLDTLKDIVDGATDAATAISKLNPEMKALLTTALEIIAISAGLKGVMKLFTDKNLLIGAGALLPGWTKLLAIIPAVIGAIALYKSNLDSVAGGIAGLRREQDELMEKYQSQIDAAEDAANSTLGEAKTAETLAEKLEELSKKEELNVSEKAQMKSIVDQLNKLLPNLNLQIDQQTGKIIGNTSAIRDNISALKDQAIAQGYQAKATAAGTAYAEQEILASDTKSQLDIAKAKLADLTRSPAMKEITDIRNSLNQYPSLNEAGRAIVEIEKKYGMLNIEEQVDSLKKEISGLQPLLDEQTAELEKREREIEEYTSKASERTGRAVSGAGGSGTPSTGGEDLVMLYKGEDVKYVKPSEVSKYLSHGWSRTYTPKTGTGAYKNSELDNALKVLDYKKHINQLSVDDEIATLGKIKALYVHTADEQMDIDERIYDAKKQLMDDTLQKSVDWISEQKELGQLSTQQEVSAWERVLKNQSNNQEAIKQATVNLYKLRSQLAEETAQKEINGIEHWAKLGVYSVEIQIEKYRELYKTKADSAEEEYSRTENIFNLYKELLDEQQSKVKDAYDERMDAIDKEAEKKKAAQQEIIDGIEEELELLDREDTEHDYETKMADLEKERAYWSVRTGEDARQKLADTIKEIDEAEHDRETELQKQKLDDKKKNAEDEIDAIETAADKEKEKWEASYKLIEKAFDDHSDNIVARAATMSQEAYQKWVDNYLTPLRNALKTGDVEEFESGSGKLGKSISDLNSHDWGMTDADYKTFIANGEKWFATDDTAVRASLQAENDRLRKKYGQDPTLGEYPKFHTGGTVLESGRLIAKKGELILPPDLSKSVNRLFSALKSGSHTVKSTSNTTYDNKRDIKIDKLVNIEKFQPSDDVDSEIMARQIGRELTRI